MRDVLGAPVKHTGHSKVYSVGAATMKNLSTLLASVLQYPWKSALQFGMCLNFLVGELRQAEFLNLGYIL